jgi:hypothetical protein
MRIDTLIPFDNSIYALFLFRYRFRVGENKQVFLRQRAKYKENTKGIQSVSADPTTLSVVSNKGIRSVSRKSIEADALAVLGGCRGCLICSVVPVVLLSAVSAILALQAIGING